MDEDSDLLIAYLRFRPAGAAVGWASDHVKPEQPWATRWVDVRTTDPDAPDWNWAWTITGPDDPDEGDPEQQLWCFAWPYDLDVYEVWKDPTPPAIMPGQVCQVPVAGGRRLPSPALRSLEDEADQVGHGMIVVGGWTTRTITAALEHWTAVNAGRGDLRFHWDQGAGSSETHRTMARRAASGGPFWDLGDGLVVHDELMDGLLEDPDSAAQIEEILRRVLPN